MVWLLSASLGAGIRDWLEMPLDPQPKPPSLAPRQACSLNSCVAVQKKKKSYPCWLAAVSRLLLSEV